MNPYPLLQAFCVALVSALPGLASAELTFPSAGHLDARRGTVSFRVRPL